VVVLSAANYVCVNIFQDVKFSYETDPFVYVQRDNDIVVGYLSLFKTRCDPSCNILEVYFLGWMW